MKSNFRRRSAFGVYQSQLKKEDEILQKEEEIVNKPSGSKKRPHEENSSSRSSKKASKSSSNKSLNMADTNGNFDHDEQTPDILEPKQKGKGRLLSKANKLRQSLGMSSRKKKRNDYRSYDRVDQQNPSSPNLAVHSVSVEKTADKTDSETGNEETDQQEQATVNKSLDQEEIEADKLFSWLISPVKAGKFFRYQYRGERRWRKKGPYLPPPYRLQPSFPFAPLNIKK